MSCSMSRVNVNSEVNSNIFVRVRLKRDCDTMIKMLARKLQLPDIVLTKAIEYQRITSLKRSVGIMLKGLVAM